MSYTFSDLEPIIREKLAMGAEVKIAPKGTSMLPLIHQGRDEVILTAVKGRLKKYDIPFYKRKDGSFILHRVIRVRKNDYIMCGDNQTMREYGVTDDMIIGVAKKLICNGKELNMDNLQYKIYCRLHVLKQSIKGLCMGVMRKGIKLIRKKTKLG